MKTSPVLKSDPSSTQRRLRFAGIAAVVGCAAWCTLPLLAAAVLGSGAAATLSAVFRPGTELIVGVAVFVLALGFLALRSRRVRNTGSGSPPCAANGGCCDRGTTPSP